MGSYSIYLARGRESCLLFLSPAPEYDYQLLAGIFGWQEFCTLTPPLPLGIAARLLDDFQQKVSGRQGVPDWPELERIWQTSLRLLKRFDYPLPAGLSRAVAFHKIDTAVDHVAAGSDSDTGSLLPDGAIAFHVGEGRVVVGGAADRLDGQICALLQGRLLRQAEMARLLHCNGAGERKRLEHRLQRLTLQGEILLIPALVPVRGSVVRCQRCGWEGIPPRRDCAACGSTACCDCPSCLVMGSVSLCEPLYSNSSGRVDSYSPESRGFFSQLAYYCRIISGQLKNGRLRPQPAELICRPLILTPAGARYGLRSLTEVEERVGTDMVARKPVETDDIKDRSLPVARGNGGEPQQLQLTTGDKGRIPPDKKAAEPLQSDRKDQPAGELIPASINLEVELTPAQRDAARGLLQFWDSGEGDCLVWAACGAGKTEVSFPVIAAALQEGKRVLYTTPRREVVLEIAPRLERAFGKGKVVALYGGSGNLGVQAPLVAATTHQCLRCYREFDLVVLDEGDAFPYPGNRMLHYGVERARRPGGKVIYLTATPPDWLLHRGEVGKLPVLKIPSRPHGFPLPEPQLLRVEPFTEQNGRLILHNDLLNLIRATLECYRVPVFIFVPTVELTKRVGEALRRLAGRPPFAQYDAGWVEWCHAGDRERGEKRKRFFSGEFPLLVTTTIMERGVTLPYAHVLVLKADCSSIFDTPTLVQMAGRCGRSPDYPTGEVWFVAGRVSQEMGEAAAIIREFNATADRKGYLRQDYAARLQEILAARRIASSSSRLNLKSAAGNAHERSPLSDKANW